MTVDPSSTHRADRNRLMHRLFDIMVFLKGLDGILEIVGGTALLFIKSGAIVALVGALTARELSEDPSDFFANLLRDWAANFGRNAQEFAIIYLLSHGFAKVILATSLLMGNPGPTRWPWRSSRSLWRMRDSGFLSDGAGQWR
jgi:uncharacterized membrane protein